MAEESVNVKGLTFKKDSIKIDNTQKYSEEELDSKIVIGKLVEKTRPEFVDNLRKLNARFN
jgi:hypothetical protein